jgi:hypothetical protein
MAYVKCIWEMPDYEIKLEWLKLHSKEGGCIASELYLHSGDRGCRNRTIWKRL